MPVVPANIITPHSSVEYNDGEGLVHTDLNAQQAQMNARFTDVLAAGYSYENILPTMTLASPNVSVPDTIVFVPRVGQAVPNFLGLQDVYFTDGWIAQLNPAFSNFDGSAPRLLFGRIYGNPTVTLDAADAVNDRIDLIQIRITEVQTTPISRDFKDAVSGFLTTQTFNKGSSTQVEFGVKVGTPSASPVAPTPDAGWAVLSQITVTADPNALSLLEDFRMPMRVTEHVITGRQMIYSTFFWGAGGFAPHIVNAGNGQDEAFAPAPGLYASRIIGVWVKGSWGGAFAPTVQLVASNHTSLVPVLVQDLNTIPDVLDGIAMTTIQGSIWSNVIGPGFGYSSSGPLANRRVLLSIALPNIGDTLAEVGFFMAGDL